MSRILRSQEKPNARGTLPGPYIFPCLKGPEGEGDQSCCHSKLGQNFRTLSLKEGQKKPMPTFDKDWDLGTHFWAKRLGGHVVQCTCNVLAKYFVAATFLEDVIQGATATDFDQGKPVAQGTIDRSPLNVIPRPDCHGCGGAPTGRA